jgi:spermidine/putrescine transport system permease protein
MKLYAACVYLFLYAPIAIIALFSFNAGRHASQFEGFSLQWYGRALQQPLRHGRALDEPHRRLRVGDTGECPRHAGRVGLQGIRGPVRALFDGMIYIAVMIPGIVIGIATLIALVTRSTGSIPGSPRSGPRAAHRPRCRHGHRSR